MTATYPHSHDSRCDPTIRWPLDHQHLFKLYVSLVVRLMSDFFSLAGLADPFLGSLILR